MCAALVAAPCVHAQDDRAEQAALSAQGVAGDIMDAAVEHCRRGERAQALALFTAIRAQLEPPPAILRLIGDLEATGCSGPLAARGGTMRFQLGTGWDSNVSQGINARNLVIGSGENLLDLQLDESYRPRSSAFVQGSLDWGMVLDKSGVNLQAGLAHRKNLSAPEFDVSALTGAVSKEFALSDSALRTQLELSEVWLGNSHYQRSQSAGLQWLLPERRGAWLATFNASAVQYLTQPAQNAVQLEAGILREQRLSAAQSVYAGLSLQRDNATHSRPGGDRAGYQIQVGAVMTSDQWRFKPQATYTSWRSKDVFAPGLLDVRRHNELLQLMLQAEHALTAKTSLILEWRGRWARDPIPLYRYQAQSLSAALAHRF